jgi:hypothetical protein
MDVFTCLVCLPQTRIRAHSLARLVWFIGI